MINSDVLGEVDTSMDHNKVEPSKVLMSLVIGEFERETQNRSGPNWLNEVFEAAEILLLRKTKLDDQRLLDEFGVIRSRGQATSSKHKASMLSRVFYFGCFQQQVAVGEMWHEHWMTSFTLKPHRKLSIIFTKSHIACRSFPQANDQTL